MESILNSIKKLLGIEPDYTHFDPDIIFGINSAIFILNQLGVGPSSGFSIKTADEKWSTFLGDRIDLEPVKQYVYIKTRLVFDPPSTSFLIEAMERHAKEYEWRILAQVESTITIEGGGTTSEQ